MRTIASLMAQSRKPDEIIVLASEIDLSNLREAFPKVVFYEEPDLKDWGHDKRAKGLNLATSDYTGWFNHDDSYHQSYIEIMMMEAEFGNDVVYCGWNKMDKPGFVANQSTSGNYILKTELGRKAGYTDRHYEADGTFISRISALDPKIRFVNKVLYYHNEVR